MSEFSHTGWFDCPHCGEVVPAEAKRCRHCGASDESGWQESSDGFAIGDYAEDDDFDYDAFVAREFGDAERPPAENNRRFWMQVLVIALVIALLLPLALQIFRLLSSDSL